MARGLAIGPGPRRSAVMKRGGPSGDIAGEDGDLGGCRLSDSPGQSRHATGFLSLFAIGRKQSLKPGRAGNDCPSSDHEKLLLCRKSTYQVQAQTRPRGTTLSMSLNSPEASFP